MKTPINNLRDLQEKIELCKNCVLAEYRTRVVPGKLSKDSRVMFIGIAPKQSAELEGEPFPHNSYSGQILRQWLNQINLPIESVYLTNILKCNPDKKPRPYPLNHFDEGVFHDEIIACRQWLAQEIILLQPKVIVTLGAPALHQFFPTESVSSFEPQGRMYKDRMHFALFHPRNVEGAKCPGLEKRLEKLKHFLEEQGLNK